LSVAGSGYALFSDCDFKACVSSIRNPDNAAIPIPQINASFIKNIFHLVKSILYTTGVRHPTHTTKILKNKTNAG